MKANEAPAKLYVNSNDHLTYNGYYAFTNKMRACDIEYTRTDAFIEKARKWFIEHTNVSQEEPVSEDKMTISKEWFEHCKKSWYNEGYIDGKYNRDRQFEEPVSNSDWLTELQEKLDNATPEQLEELWNKYNGVDEEESVSEELEKVVEEIVDPTVLNAYGVKEIANRLRRTMIDSVSDDLGEYINELSKQFPEVSFAKLSRIAVRVANWQKEQMIAKAIDVKVKVDAGSYPYIPQIELYDYDKDVPLAKEGDKYKVVLIKED